MTTTDLPGYSGVGPNRATQLRNQQEALWSAADKLDQQSQRSLATMTDALAALDRTESAADRLRKMAEKGRNA